MPVLTQMLDIELPKEKTYQQNQYEEDDKNCFHYINLTKKKFTAKAQSSQRKKAKSNWTLIKSDKG